MKKNIPARQQNKTKPYHQRFGTIKCPQCGASNLAQTGSYVLNPRPDQYFKYTYLGCLQCDKSWAYSTELVKDDNNCPTVWMAADQAKRTGIYSIHTTNHQQILAELDAAGDFRNFRNRSRIPPKNINKVCLIEIPEVITE